MEKNLKRVWLCVTMGQRDCQNVASAADFFRGAQRSTKNIFSGFFFGHSVAAFSNGSEKVNFPFWPKWRKHEKQKWNFRRGKQKILEFFPFPAEKCDQVADRVVHRFTLSSRCERWRHRIHEQRRRTCVVIPKNSRKKNHAIDQKHQIFTYWSTVNAKFIFKTSCPIFWCIKLHFLLRTSLFYLYKCIIFLFLYVFH